jgi:hypothetical protein
MLRKLQNDEKPEYIAAVWDSLDGTFRDDLYADYKANRQAMPDADRSRWVTTDSLGDVLAFLLSDGARDISGAAIPVYGRAGV